MFLLLELEFYDGSITNNVIKDIETLIGEFCNDFLKLTEVDLTMIQR